MNVYQEFTRVNSLQCLWRLFKYYKKDIKNGYLNINVTMGGCVINPGKRLSWILYSTTHRGINMFFSDQCLLVYPIKKIQFLFWLFSELRNESLQILKLYTDLQNDTYTILTTFEVIYEFMHLFVQMAQS